MIKAVTWMGRSKSSVRAFPDPARREAGYQLFQVQQGDLPDDWKPMSSIGPGVIEMRLHKSHEHRVIYLSKFEEAVYVLHAFEKKTRQTRKHDIDVAKRGFKEVIKNRIQSTI